jgi:hypothetical protein
MGLLDSILLAPVKGPYWIAKKVHEMAMEELLDEDSAREELKELYTLLETGKIGEEEFEHREEELVERMEEVLELRAKS